MLMPSRRDKRSLSGVFLMIVCNMQPCKYPITTLMDHHFFGKSLMCGRCSRWHINWVIKDDCINPFDYFPSRFEEERIWIQENIIETDQINDVKIKGKQYICFYRLTNKDKKLLKEMVI